MGKDTKIPWCHASWNPWMGCTKVSPGCANCYAECENLRYGRDLWGPDAPRQRTSAAYWKQPLKWNAEAASTGVRQRVFCGSWCDVMEAGIYLYLDWLLLTKRPENFGPLLPEEWRDRPRPNVWLLATVENADYLWRTDHLKATPAVVHGLSIEPMLGPMPTLGEHLDGIDVVIVGAESGRKRRPFLEDWARGARDQCIANGTRFFYKQRIGEDGRKIEMPELDGRTWDQMPEVKRG